MKAVEISIIAGVLFLTALPARSESDRFEEIKLEIEELKAKVEELNSSGDGARKALENIEVAKEQVEAARTEIEEIEESLKKDEYLLGIYRNAFRVVSKVSPGTSLGASVFLKDGSTLQNVVYVGAARGGVKVETSTGPRVVPFALMPETWTQYFALPPSIPEPGSGLVTLIETKPESAWTEEAKKAYEQEMAVAQVAPQEEEEAMEESAESSSAASSESASSEADENEARLARNKERIRKIYLLRAEYNKLAKKQRDQKRAKYAKQEEFRRMKIKKAQAQIDQALSIYDQEIEKLAKQMEKIQTDITNINATME
ncbi:MAG: hypothetical protein CMO55_04865 [Verrucomicrobiales bacterium]|nr:hypothetical protein [Verrucomicrobiales bacterium]